MPTTTVLRLSLAAAAIALSVGQASAQMSASAPAAAKVAPTALHAASALKAVLPTPLCDTCGTVLEVKTEKRKGSGGALGMIGGAVAGGVVANKVGDGNKVAAVAGAAGGAILGNEIQKRLNRKTIHITTVKMKNGASQVYESEQAPGWAVGDVVRLAGGTFVKL